MTIREEEEEDGEASAKPSTFLRRRSRLLLWRRLVSNKKEWNESVGFNRTDKKINTPRRTERERARMPQERIPGPQRNWKRMNNEPLFFYIFFFSLFFIKNEDDEETVYWHLTGWCSSWRWNKFFRLCRWVWRKFRSAENRVHKRDDADAVALFRNGDMCFEVEHRKRKKTKKRKGEKKLWHCQNRCLEISFCVFSGRRRRRDGVTLYPCGRKVNNKIENWTRRWSVWIAHQRVSHFHCFSNWQWKRRKQKRPQCISVIAAPWIAPQMNVYLPLRTHSLSFCKWKGIEFIKSPQMEGFPKLYKVILSMDDRLPSDLPGKMLNTPFHSISFGYAPYGRKVCAGVSRTALTHLLPSS